MRGVTDGCILAEPDVTRRKAKKKEAIDPGDALYRPLRMRWRNGSCKRSVVQRGQPISFIDRICTPRWANRQNVNISTLKNKNRAMLRIICHIWFSK